MSRVCFCICFLLIVTFTRGNPVPVEDEDEVFYNNLEKEIAGEVKTAKSDLISQAKIIEVATKNYAAAKVKQNLFKALRGLAEKELDQISMQDRLRQPRQDNEDEEGTEEDATTQRVVPLIPVVANILKSVFGGSNETGRGGVNITYHLQSASKIITRPFQGLTNLLGLRPTETPFRIIQASGPVNINNATTVPLDVVVAKLVKKYYHGNQKGKSAKSDIPVGHIVESNNTTAKAPITLPSNSTVPVNQTTTEEPPLVGVIYIDELTKDVEERLDVLIKAMPDLFEGAREAITLINNIRELLDE